MTNLDSKSSGKTVNPFNPEELEKVQGPTYAGERPERRLQEAANEAEEITGLDFDSFDEFRVEDLQDDAIAQTRQEVSRYSEDDSFRTVLAADPELLDKDSYIKIHALTHENVHSRHFNNRLYTTLVDQGISGEDAGELHQLMEDDKDQLEGGTEIITHFLNPGSRSVGQVFYPDEMEEVKEKLGDDTEILEDIEESGRELVREYQDIYDVEVKDGVYREKGSFAGQDYDALVVGEGAEMYGGQMIQEYLFEENYSDGEYTDFPEEGAYHHKGIMENGIDEDYRE